MVAHSMVKRKQEEHEEIDSEGTWAVSYGDMVTLLLTFFIIFFSTDPKQGTKQRVELKVALIETLKNQSATNSDESGHRAHLNIGNKKEEGIDLDLLKKWNGVIHDKGNHIIIEFPTVSFFKSAQVDLTEQGIKALKNFVEVYMPYAAHYIIKVHAFTDSRLVKSSHYGRFRDNLELSALRAVAGIRVLQKSGIPLNLLRAGGFAEAMVTARELQEVPVDLRTDKMELALARKIVLVIEPEGNQ